MSMECKECGKEIDLKNDYIICEDCKTMYFRNKGALQSYLKQIYNTMTCDFKDVAFELRQKQLEDSRLTTLKENEALKCERIFSSLLDDISILEKSNYNGAQEKEWAEKLYEFNSMAKFLIKFYTDKLNGKEDTL